MTTFRPGITVCIPSIPPRAPRLLRALASVTSQTLQPEAVSVAIDHKHEGAGPTRTRAVRAAATEWCAMLDDDDSFRPHHLSTLYGAAMETGADFVFSWFDIPPPGRDPFPQHFGKVFDPLAPTHTTVTVLVRTELAQEIGYVSPEGGDGAGGSGEDWNFVLGCIEAGAKFHHVPVRSWIWNHWSGNTSGRGDRW
jgi:Glycosyl transferase family 2